jgi:hypothetical protein
VLGAALGGWVEGSSLVEHVTGLASWLQDDVRILDLAIDIVAVLALALLDSATAIDVSIAVVDQLTFEAVLDSWTSWGSVVADW